MARSANLMDITVDPNWIRGSLTFVATLWGIVVTNQHAVTEVASFDQLLPFYAIEIACIASLVHWASGKCAHPPPARLVAAVAVALSLSTALVAAGYVFHVGIPAFIAAPFRPLQSNWGNAVRALLVAIGAASMVGVECIADHSMFSSAGGYAMYLASPRTSPVAIATSIFAGIHWHTCSALWDHRCNPAHVMALGASSAAVLGILVAFFATMTGGTYGSINGIDFSGTAWQLLFAGLLYCVLYLMILFISLDMSFDLFVCLSVTTAVVVVGQSASEVALPVTSAQVAGAIVLLVTGIVFSACVGANGIMATFVGKRVWRCEACEGRVPGHGHGNGHERPSPPASGA